MAAYTFLEHYDFSDKTIIPFCTHAGIGLSVTLNGVQKTCSDATNLDGLPIAETTAQNDRESTEKQVSDRLGK